MKCKVGNILVQGKHITNIKGAGHEEVYIILIVLQNSGQLTEVTNFWDVTPCSLEESHQLSG
jgi:hypothetical protein